MAEDLSKHHETTDGSRPEAVPLDEGSGKKYPLSAFTILASGDVFEAVGARPPPDGPAKALAYVDAKIVFHTHGAQPAVVERVRSEIVKQLSGNLQLLSRMNQARPIEIDLVPENKGIASYGYPKAVAKTAAGLFWDDPKWSRARIALRQDSLTRTPQLVFHEMAHAIHYMGFTKEERDLIYRLLLRTFGNRASADEAFAIYSEKEFLDQSFSDRDYKAPGVYGFTRQRWDENHVFTRFVRNLYFPYKKLAGHPTGSGGGGWSQFSG
jgi:hypothetical protein